MVYIKEYWTEKEKRAEIARKHAKKMDELHNKKIQESIRGTIVYSPGFVYGKKVDSSEIKISLKNSDSVNAIFSSDTYNDKRMAVLNFASYKNPGGMFINGSKAQEECLCHESFLYNVLKEFPEYYEWNNSHKNKALYTNRALYSYNIMFEHDQKQRYCDVITCAAPNFSAATKYQKVSRQENNRILISRIQFVLDIAMDNNVGTLILGAYGCGVFGQNPREVALIFKNLLESGHYNFNEVIFAIPKDGTNYEEFERVFNERIN